MRRVRINTIRKRLLVAFLAVALLPTVSIGLGSAAVGYYTARQQTVDRLESIAARKELAIRSWISSLQNQLLVAANTEGETERISVVLDLARDDKYYDFYNKAVRNRLRRIVLQSPQLRELTLIDTGGRAVLTTDPDQEVRPYGDQSAVQRALAGTYVSWPDASRPGTAAFLVAFMPIAGHDGRPLGVIAVRAILASLDPLLQEQTGLARTGKSYLVAPGGTLVAGAPAGIAPGTTGLHAPGLDRALATQSSTAGLYDDFRGAPVVGVYRWLPDLGVVLVTEQERAEAFGAVNAIILLNLSVGASGVALAIVVSLFVTRSLAMPIADLAGTATRVAAGHLEQIAVVQGDDEIAALARAFNSMTAQLRELINSLERRVAERTFALQEANQALGRRAVQLETSVRISRGITSVLDVNVLLHRVVDLIQDSFGYYRVLIFLFDREANMLVLRASSGDTDPKVQRLDLAERSINTRAIQTGEPQVVNDVAQNPDYLRDECMPATRSELIIPLRLADQCVGTLDVHCTELNAFAADDVRVIQGLGDQIAVAIENARLYDRSKELAVLEERTRLARELHDSVTQSLYSLTLLAEGWRRLANGGSPANVDDYLTRIGEITQQALREMRLLIHELRPPALEREGFVGALHQRLDSVERRVGVEARLLMDDLVEIPRQIEEGLYRIALEALNNALKHAQAESVTVHVSHCGGEVVVEVSDNGRGFDPEATVECGGMGLATMRERARQLGGMLTIVSGPGQGTVVSARIPAAASVRRLHD